MLEWENLKDKKGGSKATAFIIIGGNKMNEIKSLSIDLETYSDVDLSKCGVYKYTESDNFEILLLKKIKKEITLKYYYLLIL